MTRGETRVLGREAEMAAVDAFLLSAEVAAAAMVIEGEPGIGKTTLWRAALDRARERGCRLLCSRPAAAEAKLSFAGLADLLADVGDEVLASLPPPQERALQAALLRRQAEPRAAESRTVFAGLLSTLAVLSEQQPLLVAVDDLQWLDRATQGALAFTLRRLGGRRAGFLATLRLEEGRLLPEGLQRALAEAAAATIHLAPLSLASLHAILSDRLGLALPRPLLLRLSTACGGNPFYALEIGRELARRGMPAAGEVLPAPEDLSRLVARRIARLPAATREALLEAAALSSPSVELVRRSALAAAEEAGLLQTTGGRVSFAHPLYAAAVYGSASEEARRAAHRRLAARVADAEERARHLALAAEGPSEEVAAALGEAARQARARGAAEAAAELAELALRLTSAGRPRRRVARALAAAEHALAAGDLARARALAEEAAADCAAGAARGRALVLLARARYHQESFVEAAELLQRGLAELGGAERAVPLVELAYVLVNLGQFSAAALQARQAVEAAEESGDEGLLSAALAASVISDFYAEEGLDWGRLERALAREDPDRELPMPLRATLIAAIVEHLSDRLDTAALRLAELRRRTLERGEESGLPLLDAHLAMAERRRGNLRRALAAAQEGHDVALLIGSESGLLLSLAERCYARASLGEVEGARADAAQAAVLYRRAALGFGSLWARWAVAFLELSCGQAQAAWEALEPVAARIEATGRCDPALATILPDAVEALVELGELDRSESLVARLEENGRRYERPSVLSAAARNRALLLAARGETGRAEEAAAEAVACAREELPLELGRALLVKGRIERRAGRRRQARESLGRALALFEALEAGLWAARARAELRRLGLRRGPSDALTATEERVARLAASGLTNREIAQRLFISAKTVEANLARVYRKLGIHSRAELGARMGAREGSGTT